MEQCSKDEELLLLNRDIPSMRRCRRTAPSEMLQTAIYNVLSSRLSPTQHPPASGCAKLGCWPVAMHQCPRREHMPHRMACAAPPPPPHSRRRALNEMNGLCLVMIAYTNSRVTRRNGWEQGLGGEGIFSSLFLYFVVCLSPPHKI